MNDLSKLEAMAVSHRYPGRRALSVCDVSVTIRQSERVAILGESGSGKSTFVSLLAGVQEPTSGRVLLNGREVSAVTPHDRQIALVLQKPPYLANTRVGELLARPARRNGFPSKTKSVQEILKQLDLPDSEKRVLSGLSGGELQRVHLARTFVWRPRYIFLDEAFSSIDVGLKNRMYPLLIQHQRECSAALVVVTHDPLEAKLLCDRIVVMREGRIIADMSANDLAVSPPNAGAARLLRGVATNMLEVTTTQSSGDSMDLGTPFGSVRGRFTPASICVGVPSRALGLFDWSDIVPCTTGGDEMASSRNTFTIMVPDVSNGMRPTMYVGNGTTIYGRPPGERSTAVVLGSVATRVLLYSVENGDLLGSLSVESASL